MVLAADRAPAMEGSSRGTARDAGPPREVLEELRREVADGARYNGAHLRSHRLGGRLQPVAPDLVVQGHAVDSERLGGWVWFQPKSSSTRMMCRRSMLSRAEIVRPFGRPDQRQVVGAN